MEPGEVSDFRPAMARVVTNDSMLSVRIIRTHDNNVIRGGKITTRVFRGDRNGSWEWIRDI